MRPKFFMLAIWIVAFFSVDLAYGYHPISPYAYCANNPIKYVDPDGRKWQTAEDKQIAEEMQIEIAAKQAQLTKDAAKANAKISKISSNSKLSQSEKDVKIAEQRSMLTEIAVQQNNLLDLNNGITEISDSKSVFTFTTVPEETLAFVTVDDNGITYLNNYGTLGSRIHETTHGVQTVRGLFMVDAKGDIISNQRGVNRPQLEIPAYQNEFSISGMGPRSTVGGVPRSVKDISLPWLRGLRFKGEYIYR